MANFDKAIKVVLKNEGGFSDYPEDKGGITNKGITLSYLRAIGSLGDINCDDILDEKDIQLMDKETASKLYKWEKWDRLKYYLIHDDDIATKVLDMSVHIGESRAHRIVQEAVNILQGEGSLKVDGILGPISFKAINRSNPPLLLMMIRALLLYHYVSLYKKQPSQSKFIKGWIVRALN